MIWFRNGPFFGLYAGLNTESRTKTDDCGTRHPNLHLESKVEFWSAGINDVGGSLTKLFGVCEEQDISWEVDVVGDKIRWIYVTENPKSTRSTGKRSVRLNAT